MGATPSAQGGCSLWWGGACSVGPTSVLHSTMISCFFGVLGFLCKRSCLCSSLLLRLQAFSLPTLSPPWVLTPNLTLQHPSALHNRSHTTQTGMHRAATPIMSAVLTLSSFHRLSAAFPSIPCRSLCIPSNFPTLQGFSECWNLSSPSASCQGAGPVLDLSFIFFLSFVLPNDRGIFLVLLGV